MSKHDGNIKKAQSSTYEPGRMSQRPIQAIHGHFVDFDHLEEAITGWDLQWRQLDAGRRR